ncbi:MAG: SPOR domain-containing protein [Ilumatobacter sp.]|nr:SPOR domain-containing protein [Ilumatobacter sp.]
MDHDDEWYWDLKRGKAVQYRDRGKGDHTLGPYATKVEAENWKATSEQRNEAWDAADDEWENADR